MPFFSIVIPVYNVETYLSECVDSILTQSFSDYEVILVDDGSSDSSPAMCDEYSEHNKKVFTYHKSNGGPADARNFGLQKAAGMYICFMDSDDAFSGCDALKQIYGVLESSRFPEVLMTQRNTNCSISITGKEYLSIMLQHWQKKKIIDIVVWDKIYKKELLDSTGIEFLEGYVHEDDFWTLAVLSKAKTCLECEIDFYFHRENQQSITRNVTQKSVLNRASSKLYIADYSVRFFKKELRNDKLYSSILTFYLAVYMGGVKEGLKLTEKEYIETYESMLLKTNSICLEFRRSSSLKHKIIYIAYRLGGINLIRKLLTRMG